MRMYCIHLSLIQYSHLLCPIWIPHSSNQVLILEAYEEILAEKLIKPFNLQVSTSKAAKGPALYITDLKP